MATYKRPGKSKFYWTRFEFGGKEIRQSTKCTNQKEADKYEANLRVELQYGRIGIDYLGSKAAKPIPFVDAMADYLNNLEVKASTQRRYASASKALISFFDRAAANSITSEDVERFRALRKKQNKKAPARVLAKNPKARLDKQILPATVNRELTLMSGLFRWLLKNKKVKTNPVKDVAFLQEDNLQNRVVTESEFRSYLMAASQPLRDVAVVMYHTGMRPGEVFALTVSDLDFENGILSVAKGKTKAARRQLEMSDARNVLTARHAAAKGDLLFPGGKNGDQETPLIKLTNAHLAAIERVNKIEEEKGRSKIRPFRLYDLRHTFATEYVAAGGDLLTLAAILGHTRLEMMMRYAHPTQQHRAASIERLRAFRNQQSNVRRFSKTA